MRFETYYPIAPHKLNQKWGTYDPKDYAQFGFNRHNGIDVAIGSDALIRAPFNGRIYEIGNQPTGGGIFIGFLSDDQFTFDAFTCKTPDNVVVPFKAMTCFVLMDFLHLKSVIGTVDGSYRAGDILAVQDNTGFSTGPHTHIQPRRVSYDGKILDDLDTNTAHDSFDPTQFFNGIYAKDIPALQAIVQATSNVVTQIAVAPLPVAQKLSWLQSLLDAISALFKGRNQ